ncbi:hypothetical protein OHB06_02475 [Streptomyces sp. NBC_01604]|uniref:hypothetical protein n=1 Tax=Streptomyces sp. NBC_01604 TaxID=2975894 RepID=UPI003865E97E
MGVQDLPEEQPQPSADREKAVSFRARRLWGEVGAFGGGLELARSAKSVLKVSPPWVARPAVSTTAGRPVVRSKAPPA